MRLTRASARVIDRLQCSVIYPTRYTDLRSGLEPNARSGGTWSWSCGGGGGGGRWEGEGLERQAGARGGGGDRALEGWQGGWGRHWFWGIHLRKYCALLAFLWR